MNQQLPSFQSLRPTSLAADAIGGVGGQRPPHISIDSGKVTALTINPTGKSAQKRQPRWIPGWR